MVDTFTLEGAEPKPFSSCPSCGSTAFENGRTVGLSKEIFCRDCGAGYKVHVLHDGLFLIDGINSQR